MNTTNLFVELVVIGVGAFVWIVLLILGFTSLGIESITDWIKLETAIPLLALIYVLGIVTDRLADTVFEKLWADTLRQNKFGNLADYYKARRDILTKSEKLSELLEYGRSRLRICRGWCFNSALIAISLNAFLLLQSKPHLNRLVISSLGTSFCVLLALGCWYSWKKIAESEYRKVEEQSDYLMSENETK